MERTYRVHLAGDGVIATAPTFAQAMSAALRLTGPDDVVTIDRSTDRPGLFIMQARYLPTGPGRGWDFGMMSSDADPDASGRAILDAAPATARGIARVPFAHGPDPEQLPGTCPGAQACDGCPKHDR